MEQKDQRAISCCRRKNGSEALLKCVHNVKCPVAEEKKESLPTDILKAADADPDKERTIRKPGRARDNPKQGLELGPGGNAFFILHWTGILRQGKKMVKIKVTGELSEFDYGNYVQQYIRDNMRQIRLALNQRTELDLID